MDDSTLSSLFVANDKFSELERAFDVFCPFEATGMISQELRHGHFLSYIFDPHRPHGFGSECLAALMRAAIRTAGRLADLSLLDVHLMDLQGAIVRREWKNLDILIEVPDQRLVIAIELKIDAKEHGQQLSTYRKNVEGKWPEHRHLFLFLTKNGDDPSELAGAGWQSVELEQLAAELETFSRRRSGHVTANTMLDAYLSMLRRHHLNDEKLEELAASLWAKHREALEFLADRRPDALGDLFKRFIDDQITLAQEISQGCKHGVVVDYCRAAAIYFAIEEWDAVPQFKSAVGFTPSGRLLLLQLEKAVDCLRCYFIIGRGDAEVRQKIFSRLKDAKCDLGEKNKQLAKDWSRLASFKIPLKDLDGQDLDGRALEVRKRIKDFASKHIGQYTDALRPLMGQQ